MYTLFRKDMMVPKVALVMLVLAMLTLGRAVEEEEVCCHKVLSH
jgi:hypothetical protein